MKDAIFGDGVPMGFGMALAQNTDALERFSSMSPAQRQSVLDGVHGINSKDAMRDYVDRLGRGAML